MNVAHGLGVGAPGRERAGMSVRKGNAAALVNEGAGGHAKIAAVNDYAAAAFINLAG